MKRNFVSLAVIALLFSAIFTACSSKDKVDIGELKNLTDSASYAFGMNMGSSMKMENMDINPEVFVRAFRQAYKGDTAGTLNQQQMQEIMMKYQQSMQEKQQAAAKEKGKANREKGAKFLAENKSKEGVLTTASGLQYKVVKEGSGVKPTENDRVRIQYRLKTIDGKVVESTFERNGEPVIMGLNGIIQGMKEGLMLMTPGSTYMFWINPDLGYGDMDSPELPAGSVLCFEVQLVDVVKSEAANKK